LHEWSDARPWRWINDIYKLTLTDIPSRVPDERKAWDRRWARAFLDACEGTVDEDTVRAAAALVYDDDADTWEALLARDLASDARHIGALRNGAVEDEDVPPFLWSEVLLARCAEVQPEVASRMREAFLEAGYPEALLDRLLARTRA
jgi:hypothetical protein